MLATQPLQLTPPAWAGQGASAVKEASDQWVQFLADWLAWGVAFVQAVWAWSSDQIVTMTQVPWENWPLWKQLTLIIVAGIVIYTLYFAARQLWWAVLNLLSAVAAFVGTLIVTLPTIFLAGAIALAGLWIINHFHDLSSLRSIMMTFPESHPSPGSHPDGNTPSAPDSHDPGETTDGP
jgi:hypothetical protein